MKVYSSWEWDSLRDKLWRHLQDKVCILTIIHWLFFLRVHDFQLLPILFPFLSSFFVCKVSSSSRTPFHRHLATDCVFLLPLKVAHSLLSTFTPLRALCHRRPTAHSIKGNDAVHLQLLVWCWRGLLSQHVTMATTALRRQWFSNWLVTTGNQQQCWWEGGEKKMVCQTSVLHKHQLNNRTLE